METISLKKRLIFKNIFSLKAVRKEFNLLFSALKLIFSTSPKQSALLVIILILQGMIPAVTIKLSAYLIDQILNSLHTFGNSNIATLCLIWGGSLFIHDIINPIVFFLQGNIADKAVFNINKSLIIKSNAIQGIKAFEEPSYYNDIQLIQSQAHHKPLNLVVTLVGLLRDIVIVTSCLVLLSTLVLWISIVVLAGAYINFKVFSLIQQKTWQENLGRSPQSRRMNYISSLAMNSAYAKEMRFFNIGGYLFREYVGIFTEIHSRMYKLRFKQMLWPIAPLLLSVLGNLTALYYVLNMTADGVIGIGSIALLLQSLSQLHLSVASFGEQAGWVKGHLLFFEKYFSFLKLDEKVFKSSQEPLYVFEEEIRSLEFQNISFSYEDDREALQNISFDIKSKEIIAIVGANGAGKSTLIKLLCGLYASTSGRILINGKRLQSFDLESWRKKIAPVFQDFCPYSLSIEKNISMGSETEQRKMQSTITQCGLDELVSKLPEGLYHMLGKAFGGTDLSGGQWQKVALARAIYKNADIYILDEPTAALDPISEQEVFTQFKSICKDKTVIFVTHRLASVKMADRILLLDQGKLVAQGTHDELMSSNKLYSDMFNAQAKQYLA